MSTINSWKTGRAWTVKLFIMGLPGSGKSSVARDMTEYVRKIDLETVRINDYAILEQMFHDDTEGEQFKPAAHDGFDIIDLEAFNTSLKYLEREVRRYISTTRFDGMIIIEFARNDYQKAFQQFEQDFLQDAFFLYLDTDIETCKRRIRERIASPETEDDYYVSDYIFNAYYNGDDGQDIPRILEEIYRVEKQHVAIIDNSVSIQEASTKIHSFIDAFVPVNLPV